LRRSFPPSAARLAKTRQPIGPVSPRPSIRCASHQNSTPLSTFTPSIFSGRQGVAPNWASSGREVLLRSRWSRWLFTPFSAPLQKAQGNCLDTLRKNMISIAVPHASADREHERIRLPRLLDRGSNPIVYGHRSGLTNRTQETRECQKLEREVGPQTGTKFGRHDNQHLRRPGLRFMAVDHRHRAIT
jgi:hypothetical protein